MIQEARPWLVDFDAAAALDSFRVFWGVFLGLFLVVFASWDVGFSHWVVSGVVCVLGSGFGVFLFRPADPPAQCRGWSG